MECSGETSRTPRQVRLGQQSHKQGIAVVELEDEGMNIRFRIIHPGREMKSVVERSLGLGTWGERQRDYTDGIDRLSLV